MQIESQNYVLEDPQFGNSGQLTPEDTQTQQVVTQTPTTSSSSSLLYIQIGVGILIIVLVWWIVRRRSTRQ